MEMKRRETVSFLFALSKIPPESELLAGMSRPRHVGSL